MAQILDSVPNSENDNILCCYVNSTSQIQIARITNVPNWHFERVVFPGQRLVFEAVSDGMLEIHSGMMASAIISDTIPCERLCLQEQAKHQSIKQEQKQQNVRKTLNSSPGDRYDEQVAYRQTSIAV